VRLSQRHLAVDENRDPTGRIDRQKCGLTLLALRQIHQDLGTVEPQL
jgi:hypothetical protein